MQKKKRTAYSLLELSIVIVIISILITGAMTTAVGNISVAKVKVTKDRMKVIYNAIGAFVATNGRLPCPAAITLLKSNTNYGKEVGTAGNCTTANQTYLSTYSNNLVYGMVPAVTLGLSKDLAEDGFEDKIAYVVDKNFTSSATLSASPNFSPSQVNFSIYAVNNTGNNIAIYEKSGAATFTTMTQGVITLISYGANKNGAFGINSTTRNARSTDADEQSNEIDNSNNFDRFFTASSENSDLFDDILFFADPRQIIDTFSLYRLLPCNNSLDANYNTNDTPTTANDLSWNAWFGQTIYGDACGGSDYDKNYVKKCGPFGAWIVMNTCTLP